MKKKAFIYLINALFLLTCFAEIYAQRNKLANTVEKVNVSDILSTVDADVIAGLNKIYPRQTAGVSVGAGFQNDFNDTSICIRGEYLNRISTIKDNSALYGGADLSYLTSNYSDVKNNLLNFGGKLQIHSPITSTGQTQWVNGIRGDYFTGSRKYQNLKDDLSGISASYFTGLNIQVNENLFVGAETNVFTFENLKIKPEGGGEVEYDDTTLNVNKGNRINLSVRFRF